MRFSLLSFGLFAASAIAVPTSNHVLHEKRHAPLKKWAKRHEVPHEHTLPMRFGLIQNNLENGHDMLMEVSDPNSPKYGKYYSAEEIVELFAPARERVDAVREWLHSAGIEPHRITESANKQWLQLDALAHEANDLLKTKFHFYEHLSSGKHHVACDEYHLPTHIRHHIDYVTPGLKLMAGGKVHGAEKSGSELDKRGFRTSGNTGFLPPIFGAKVQNLPKNPTTEFLLAHCDTLITPPCIAAMYNISKPTKAAKGNQLGIFEEGDFYAAEDLVEFFTTLAPQIPPTTEPILHGIDGGFAPSAAAGGESDLDFQISYPIVYPQQEILFQTDDIFYATGVEGGGGFLNTFLDAIDGSYCTYSAFGETGDASIDPKYPDPNPAGYQGKTQCGVYKPTHVISISYGEQEDDLPTNYQQRQCSEFMKLGMRGTTIVIASGDSGVAARSTDDNNADGCLGTGQVFNPDFPASCPYITAAGATFLPPGGNAKKDQEVAVTRFPSGGGFSNIYARPSYQSTAVQNYFNTANIPYKSYSVTGTNNPTPAQYGNGVYNRAGRGYPDISAVGDNVVIFNNGAPTLIGGTSASAPVFAAIINRINEERIAAGKGTVGFVNPTLYAHPEIFHDITVGNNSGCNTAGFFAAKGWDPVTGLGTPNYPAMLKQFLSQ